MYIHGDLDAVIFWLIIDGKMGEIHPKTGGFRARYDKVISVRNTDSTFLPV
jgi:hypothetical protein